MRQRRILMPTAEIRGTHLNTSREFAEMQERIAAETHQRIAAHHYSHGGRASSAPGNVGEPSSGSQLRGTPCASPYNLKSRDELYRAWAIRDAEERGETQQSRNRFGRSTSMNDMSDIPQDLLTQSIAGRRLNNKCIILTGAAGSIGNYITRQLLREGARVMLTGRDQSKLDDFMGDLVAEGFEETFMVARLVTVPTLRSAEISCKNSRCLWPNRCFGQQRRRRRLPSSR